MIPLLLIASFTLISIQNLCLKVFGARGFLKNAASFYIYSMGYQLMAIVIFSFGAKFDNVSPATFWLAVFSGFIYVFAFLLYSKAMAMGPMSFTTLLFNLGVVIPVIFGMAVWHEKVNVWQTIGFVLLCVTFYLSSISENGNDKKASLQWLLFCSVSMVGSGFLMVASKYQQVLAPGVHIREFMIITFATAILITLPCLWWQMAKRQDTITHLKHKGFISLFIIHGLISGVSSQIGLQLSNMTPATVQFPIVNGGILLLSTAYSILIYKESVSIKKGFALGIGLLSVVFLCMG